ncbi:MAG: hypothetical protein R2856_21810 [Caldilineaceae bacterium]
MYSPSLEETIFSNRFIARTVAVTLTALVLIVIGHLVFVILFPYSPLFIRFQVNVDQEGNFVTWWNSTLNLAAGIAAFLIAWLLARRPKDNRRSNRAWIAMGAMLVYIGIDDAAQIHEHTYGIFARVNAFLGQWVPYILEIGWYLWIPVLGIPAVILLLIVAKAIYKDLQANRTALILFGCGIVLLLTNPITEYVQAKKLPARSLAICSRATMCWWYWGRSRKRILPRRRCHLRK